MKRIPVTALKNRLNEFLRLVKRGETIEILEHSVPIARMEALRNIDTKASDTMDRPVREGLARAPEKQLTRSFWSFVPVPCTGDASGAVTEERGDR